VIDSAVDRGFGFMGSAHSERATVRFGVFEADFRAGELRNQGVKVKLQEQPLQILQMLLENPGEVVTREDLRKKVWPADTFVDFEQGLYNSVRRLRDALEDSADKPRFIETLVRRGYRFIGTVTTSPRQIGSIAVLPLENLSRDPEQDYFAEGLTEALITTLAKIGDLRVVSRTSVMQYKGVHTPLAAIARELGVDAIVEGTVLREGDRVRITAQLIDAAKEAHLWAESYERDLRDVLSLHSKLARDIAREVCVKLAPVDQARFPEVHPVDPEAYEAYLKGRYHWNRRSAEGLGKAIQYFQQAIAKDPTYPAAYAGLADCLSILGWWSYVSPDDGCGKAKGLAQKALEMDSSLAEAHTSLAWATMLYDHNFALAEKEFERSIELNPRYATGHQWFGLYLALMGRYEEGYTELKRATRLDPHPIVNQSLGFVLFFAGRYDQAIEQFEKALELDPGLAQAHCVLGLTYVYKGMHEAAIAAGQKAVELSQGAPLFVACLGLAYAEAGYWEEAQKILGQLNELSKQRYVTPYVLARIYAALGKKDEALGWLETGYRERTALMVCLKTDQRFDELRSDPRFQDLLRRMNFPP
jgi:TolB-like protein/Flp pilus assembly protein TadD